MNDLDMCKAFAELEGIEVYVYKDDYLLTPNRSGYMTSNGKTCDYYSPITNLSLNCAARDDYRVGVDHLDMMVNCYSGRTFEAVNFKSSDELRRAVIECILKSEGKWK